MRTSLGICKKSLQTLEEKTACITGVPKIMTGSSYGKTTFLIVFKRIRRSLEIVIWILKEERGSR